MKQKNSSKPFLNLEELEFAVYREGKFGQKYAYIAESIGAKKLGYNLTIVTPGKSGCPFHNHRINEEMFLVLEGEGVLRFGEQSYPIKKHDIIACPPGGRDVAHQITNTGKVDLKYLALSTNEPHEICEYPDSNKVLLKSEHPTENLKLIFRANATVDYLDGEPPS